MFPWFTDSNYIASGQRNREIVATTLVRWLEQTIRVAAHLAPSFIFIRCFNQNIETSNRLQKCLIHEKHSLLSSMVYFLRQYDRNDFCGLDGITSVVFIVRRLLFLRFLLVTIRFFRLSYGDTFHDISF